VFGFAARTPAEKLAGADYVFKDMAELPALLLGRGPGGGGGPLGRDEELGRASAR